MALTPEQAERFNRLFGSSKTTPKEWLGTAATNVKMTLYRMKVAAAEIAHPEERREITTAIEKAYEAMERVQTAINRN
jgi:hypothetical protein